MAADESVVTNHLPQIADALPSLIEQVVKKAALDISAQAKVKAPVDTGALRASITAEPEDAETWVVYSDKDYSVFVEFGTIHMAPEPYMRPAVDAVRGSLQAALAAIEGKLGK